MRAKDANDLLTLWTKIHGRLSPQFERVFRERPETQELVHYDARILEQAFLTSPKLKKILAEARRLDAHAQKKSHAPKPDPTPERETILPLPGDPGATRRPGKKRERYRTGEEAALRHIARQSRWW